MGIAFKRVGPNGQSRRWTLRETLQGKPMDRPSHPMLIHFPIAFYVGALGLDVLSRIGHHPAAPQAATWLICASLVGFALAAITGLAERSTMRRDLRIRKLATRHMWLQTVAAAIFAAALAIRWSDRAAARAHVSWMAIEAVGIVVMIVASDIGGVMVYKIGYRGLGGD